MLLLQWPLGALSSLLRWYLLVWIGSYCCLVLPQPAVLGQERSSGKGYSVPHSQSHRLCCPLAPGVGSRAVERHPDRKWLGEFAFHDAMTNGHQRQLKGGRAVSGSQVENAVYHGGDHGRSVRQVVTWDPQSGSREREAGLT